MQPKDDSQSVETSKKRFIPLQKKCLYAQATTWSLPRSNIKRGS